MTDSELEAAKQEIIEALRDGRRIEVAFNAGLFFKKIKPAWLEPKEVAWQMFKDFEFRVAIAYGKDISDIRESWIQAIAEHYSKDRIQWLKHQSQKENKQH